jgi:superfamily II DNA or RNA helicase
VEDLIGPIVYSKRITDLVGQQLATYRTQRVRVDLTPDERDRYNADYAVYSGYIRSRQLLGRYPRDWFRELMRRSSRDPQARGALLARQRLLQLVEDMLLLPPSGDTSETATGADTGVRVRLCTERQRQAIRALLGRAGQTEDWLLAKLHLERLDDVPYARAEQVIRRLGELARERANTRP